MTAFLQFMILDRYPAARAARWGALLGAIIVLYFGTGVYLNSPGHTDLGTAHLVHYGGVPILFALAVMALVVYALPVSVVRAVLAKGRVRWAHVSIVPGALVGLVLVASLPWSAKGMWEAMLARSLVDQPLPAAVHRYEEAHGRAPNSLLGVIPADRAELMLQTVRGCRPLSYSREPGSGTWALRAECPAGFIVVVDELVYRSKPTAPLGEHEVRLGRWRYRYD